MPGYESLQPTDPDPTMQLEERFTGLYQILGGQERSTRFYSSGYVEDLSEHSTTAVFPSRTTLLELDVVVPNSDSLIVYYIDAQIKLSGTVHFAYIGFEDGVDVGLFNCLYTQSTSYVRLVTDGDAPGGAAYPFGSFNVYRPLSANIENDPRTLTISLYTNTGGTTAWAKNIRFWAAVM